MRYLFFILPLLYISSSVKAQDAIRMSADFSIKQKEHGKGQLVTGTVYYDKKIQKIFYQINYPEPAFWLIKDSIFYEMNADTQLVNTHANVYSPAFSIYQTILTNNFDDFGLKDMGFSMGTIEKLDSTVISEWLPAERFRKALGKVLLSHTNRKINAAVFFDPNGKVLSKEQYKKLYFMEDQWIPTEITAITYKNEAVETIKITTLRNVQFNKTDHATFYDFGIPIPLNHK